MAEQWHSTVPSFASVHMWHACCDDSTEAVLIVYNGVARVHHT